MTITLGTIEKANGSAQVHLGKTKVLAGIKIEPGTPFEDTPDEGILTVNSEFVPLASPTFESGPPDENSIELARVVDRGIRESKAIDLKKLCIAAGKKVFMVFVDIYVLDHDGNLIDAAAMAALGALVNAKMHEFDVKNGEPRYKDKIMPLPMNNYPVSITSARVDGTTVLDPCLEEEQVMSCRLTVTTDKDNNICAMQKGGLGFLTPDEIKQIVSTSIAKAKDLRAKILPNVT
jgi:exosome complex component RRP42